MNEWSDEWINKGYRTSSRKWRGTSHGNCIHLWYLEISSAKYLRSLIIISNFHKMLENSLAQGLCHFTTRITFPPVSKNMGPVPSESAPEVPLVPIFLPEISWSQSQLFLISASILFQPLCIIQFKATPTFLGICYGSAHFMVPKPVLVC